MKKMMFFYSVIMLFVTLTDRANATYFPIDYTWDQPEGLGSDITLTYSYSNLLDGNMLDFNTGKPISTVSLRAAFEAALWDYAKILPIHFVEVTDKGPQPETGEYYPAGMADIRVGQVAHIEDANAYAYFPFHEDSGLAGDIVLIANVLGMIGR